MKFVSNFFSLLVRFRRRLWANSSDLDIMIDEFNANAEDLINKFNKGQEARENEFNQVFKEMKKSISTIKANQTKLDDKITREVNKVLNALNNEKLQLHGELNRALQLLWADFNALKSQFDIANENINKLEDLKNIKLTEKQVMNVKSMLKRAKKLDESIAVLEVCQADIKQIGDTYIEQFKSLKDQEEMRINKSVDEFKEGLSIHAKGLIAEMRGVLKEVVK